MIHKPVNITQGQLAGIASTPYVNEHTWKLVVANAKTSSPLIALANNPKVYDQDVKKIAMVLAKIHTEMHKPFDSLYTVGVTFLPALFLSELHEIAKSTKSTIAQEVLVAAAQAHKLDIWPELAQNQNLSGASKKALEEHLKGYTPKKPEPAPVSKTVLKSALTAVSRS